MPSDNPPPIDPEISWLTLAVRMFRLARAAHPRPGPRAAWRRVLLFLRQCRQHRQLRAWHRAAPDSALQVMLAWRPTLVAALERPYINGGWDTPRRLGAIESHYRSLTGAARGLRLEPGALRGLAGVHARGQALDLVLDSPAWFVHEGELSLSLFLDGERIYTVVFSLGADGGRPALFVGALQGLGSARALEIYRQLTRGLHGMRPRDLLVAALRMLCRAIGVQALLAVGDAARVSDSGYFGRAARVHSSYDAAWQDQRGTRRADGFWALPVVLPRRPHESIPPRKRSEYRQRYAMLDRLEADMCGALGVARPGQGSEEAEGGPELPAAAGNGSDRAVSFERVLGPSRKRSGPLMSPVRSSPVRGKDEHPPSER